MAGVSGNNAFFAFSKQATKGTAAASVQHTPRFTGGNIEFDRQIERFEETSGSRDQSPSYVSAISVAGSPSCYLRTKDAAGILEGVLGTRITSGVGPYTHTITGSNTTVPYMTFWQNLGGDMLVNRFVDCVIDKVKISGGTGEPLELELDVIGLKGERLTTGYPTETTQSTPLLYHQVSVTKGGSAKNSVNSFEIEIENGHELQQGNGSVTAYDVAPGERKVSGSLTMLFETIEDYAMFHTGSGSGTTPSAAVQTEALVIKAANGADDYVEFTIPAVAYTSYEVEPDAKGGPIVAQINFEAEVSGSSPIITAVVKNATAGTAYAGV